MRTLQARILREEWARRETLEQLQVRRIYFALVRRIPGKGGGLLISVTRLGDFYKFLATNLGYKRSPNILVTGLFFVMSQLRKKCVATFWAIFGGNKATFFPSSSHTAANCQTEVKTRIMRSVKVCSKDR